MKSLVFAKLKGIDRAMAFGWAFLAIAALVGLAALRWGLNDSEADALVAGYWISNGDVLYRDIFSHHFPFYYWWSAVSIALFGKSILIARASVWIFQLAVFATAMIQSRYYITIGLTALIWSLLRHFYQNHFLIYFAFSTVSLVAMTAILIFIYKNREEAGIRHSIALTILAAVSILSDPMTIFAVAVMLLFLLYVSPPSAKKVYLMMGGLGGIFILYLLFTNSFQNFFYQAVIFNQSIYSNYNPEASANRLSEITNQLVSGLQIFRPEWQNFNPMRPVSMDFTDLDRWAFTGLLYRASVILTSIILFNRKEFAAGTFVYLLAATLLGISIWGHRSSNFVIFAIFLMAGLITQAWWRDERSRVFIYLHGAVSLIIGTLIFWTGYRTASFTFIDLVGSPYTNDFSSMINETIEYKHYACGQENVKLGYYPSNIYPYFFTDFRATAGYYYMWPWIAETGMDEVVNELAKEDTLTIVNRRINGSIWGYDTVEYLKPIDDLIKAQYYEARNGIFISPALAQKCEELGIITIPAQPGNKP